jgi:hypothetical protein
LSQAHPLIRRIIETKINNLQLTTKHYEHTK